MKTGVRRLNKVWEKSKELLGDLLIIWWGLWTIFLFTTIATQGYVRGIEPNLWILYIELGLSVAGTVLGAERLIQDFKRFRGG